MTRKNSIRHQEDVAAKFSETRIILLQRIKELTISFLNSLQSGQLPSISLRKYRTYCEIEEPDGTCCCTLEASSNEILSIERKGGTSRFVVMLRVLQIIQLLLQKNKHASKRDIYYTNPAAFQDQGVVDQALNDICIYLCCSRHHLNVVSPSKGLVMGWLKYVELGRHVDCTRYISTAFAVPMHVEEVQSVLSFAEYILVVEKEAVFQRLANDGFCKQNKCIVLTGKGYPDVSTRRFLRLLIDCLCIPTYALVDCDPFGFDILTTYRFGSLQMAYDAEELSAPEIRWLGAFLSDVTKFDIPERCLLPLTEIDRRKVEAMSKRCYLQHLGPEWRHQLQDMKTKGIKFEIEAISALSFSLLSEEYIPNKISSCLFI